MATFTANQDCGRCHYEFNEDKEICVDSFKGYYSAQWRLGIIQGTLCMALIARFPMMDKAYPGLCEYLPRTNELSARKFLTANDIPYSFHIILDSQNSESSPKSSSLCTADYNMSFSCSVELVSHVHCAYNSTSSHKGTQQLFHRHSTPISSTSNSYPIYSSKLHVHYQHSSRPFSTSNTFTLDSHLVYS